jgi:hypothetical protein
MVRRFHLRIAIPLPQLLDRILILKSVCGHDHSISPKEFVKLAEASFGRSCADLVTIISDCIYQSIDKAIDSKAFLEVNTNMGSRFIACEVTTKKCKIMTFDHVPQGTLLVEKLTYKDIKKVILATGPTVSAFACRKITRFTRKYP